MRGVGCKHCNVNAIEVREGLTIVFCNKTKKLYVTSVPPSFIAHLNVKVCERNWYGDLDKHYMYHNKKLIIKLLEDDVIPLFDILKILSIVKY